MAVELELHSAQCRAVFGCIGLIDAVIMSPVSLPLQDHLVRYPTPPVPHCRFSKVNNNTGKWRGGSESPAVLAALDPPIDPSPPPVAGRTFSASSLFCSHISLQRVPREIPQLLALHSETVPHLHRPSHCGHRVLNADSRSPIYNTLPNRMADPCRHDQMNAETSSTPRTTAQGYR